MANKAARGCAGIEVPKTEGVVPGRGERELAVGGYNDIRDEMVVAL
jgi:hypothetical protein